MFFRLDDGMGLLPINTAAIGSTINTGIQTARTTAPAPAPTTSGSIFSSPAFSAIIGGIFTTGAGIASGFLTAEAAKNAAKQQAKADMFAAMSQEKVALEAQRTQVQINEIAQRAETERTTIILRAVTTGLGIAAVAGVVGAIAYVASKD